MTVKKLREEQLQEWIAGEHFRYHLRTSRRPQRQTNLYCLKDGCGLAVETKRTPLLIQAEKDFRRFCLSCLETNLASVETRQCIRWRLEGNKEKTFNPQNPSDEWFKLVTDATGISIYARHERGLAHGVHYLERLMADRGELCVPYGVIERTPAFAPRITHVTGKIGRILDERLSLASHFGASGVHRCINLFDYSRNGIIPEIEGESVEKKQDELRVYIERLARYGLDLYLDINTRIFPANHPVFLTDPSRRGAPYKVVENTACQYVLCSSNEEVVSAHEASIKNLFSMVQGLAGAIFLIGGEGFMHCYTRPYGKKQGFTSCPHCASTAPSKTVAALVNRMASAVKSTGHSKLVFTWPYSAFTWSGNDRAQLEFIKYLNKDVNLLSNFDTNSEDKRNKAGVILYDYNIKLTGPSDVFLKQSKKTAESGRPIYAKTESNTTPSAFFTAYVPVHFRWHQRFKEMAKAGAAGYMNLWGFYPLTGCPPEELQYHAVWNPERKAPELLKQIAIRDFELSPSDAARAVEGWRLLSKAWDDFPYSAMTAGERQFYGRGPFHYGPAHPLIFNPQSRYGLSQEFFYIPETMELTAEKEELTRLLNNSIPRYVSDLLLTLPYGTKRYLELLGRCRRKWADGLRLLTEAIGKSPNERALMELDICTTFDIHLTTLEHVVRFYDMRDRLWHGHVDITTFQTLLNELSALLKAEIANAERSLPVVERDFRIRTYNTEMVREKILQCRYVLEEELPLFDTSVRFHVWNSLPSQ